MYVLTPDKVVLLKQLIWAGQTQQQVADDNMMSLGSIAKIVAGTQWHDIPWPDGSIGGLPDAQRQQIALHRQREVFANKKSSRKRSRRDTARLINMDLGRDVIGDRRARFMAIEQWMDEDGVEGARLATPEEKLEAFDKMIQEEIDKEEEAEKKRLADSKKRDEEMKNRPEVVLSAKDIAERALASQERHDRLHMWKASKPQFQYWERWVTHKEVEHSLDPENKMTNYLNHKEEILEWEKARDIRVKAAKKANRESKK